jgi:hypothetical protein
VNKSSDVIVFYLPGLFFFFFFRRSKYFHFTSHSLETQFAFVWSARGEGKQKKKCERVEARRKEKSLNEGKSSIIGHEDDLFEEKNRSEGKIKSFTSLVAEKKKAEQVKSARISWITIRSSSQGSSRDL